MKEQLEESKKPSCPKCGENSNVKKNGLTVVDRQKYYCKSCKKSFLVGEWKRAKPKRNDAVPDNLKNEVIKTWLYNGFINRTAKKHKISRYMVKKILVEKTEVVIDGDKWTVSLNGIKLSGLSKLLIIQFYFDQIHRLRKKDEADKNTTT